MPYVVADPLKIGGAAQFAKAWPVIDGVTSAPYAGGGQYLPVALDMEAQPQVTSDACYGLSKARWSPGSRRSSDAAQQQTSVTPIVYSNPNWWQACTGGSTAFGGYPLWIADYGVRAPAIPAGWPGYTFWQNSGNATLNGIAGAGQADLDQLGGDLITVKSGTSGSFQVRTLSSLAGQPVTYSAASTLPNGRLGVRERQAELDGGRAGRRVPRHDRRGYRGPRGGVGHPAGARADHHRHRAPFVDRR